MEEHRIALIGILVEKSEAASEVNAVLHEYASCIVGRMGIPYRPGNLNIISVVLDATGDTVSALSGKLGMISGVSVKSMQSKVLK